MGSSTITPNKQDYCCRIAQDFDLLHQAELFAGVPHEVVKLFAYLAKHKIYMPQEKIVVQGRKAEELFFLLRGQVSISTHHKGEDIIVQQLEAGSLFGELALLARFNWFFTATAATETELIIIDRQSFFKILQQHPKERDTITERIIQLRIRRLKEQTAYMLDHLAANNHIETTGKTPIV